MKTIIAGSRTVESYDDIIRAIEAAGWRPTLVISGTARGADRLGERWARENNVPLRQMPADWDRYGKRAGYLRNSAMLEHADALIALWDGQSRGTRHMIETAKDKGLVVFVWRTDTPAVR
jgi:YspA, cpYpsA-related SLOG family